MEAMGSHVSLDSSIILKMVESLNPHISVLCENTCGTFTTQKSNTHTEEKTLPSFLRKVPGTLGEFNDEITSLKMQLTPGGPANGIWHNVTFCPLV